MVEYQLELIRATLDTSHLDSEGKLEAIHKLSNGFLVKGNLDIAISLTEGLPPASSAAKVEPANTTLKRVAKKNACTQGEVRSFFKGNYKWFSAAEVRKANTWNGSMVSSRISNLVRDGVLERRENSAGKWEYRYKQPSPEPVVKNLDYLKKALAMSLNALEQACLDFLKSNTETDWSGVMIARRVKASTATEANKALNRLLELELVSKTFINNIPMWRAK